MQRRRQEKNTVSYFVTGATGFIGRHLVERLLEREGGGQRRGRREQAPHRTRTFATRE